MGYTKSTFFTSLYTLTELNTITYNIMCNISWAILRAY
nr:MAG TPA: hypothetical protein [Crassvirales sp.]